MREMKWKVMFDEYTRGYFPTMEGAVEYVYCYQRELGVSVNEKLIIKRHEK